MRQINADNRPKISHPSPAQGFDVDRSAFICVYLRSIELRMSLRTSVNFPVTAAAAAIEGLTRCVRAPLPWRPSKLRLDVDAQRCPAGTMSPFIAAQLEQPESRHSKPAAVKTRSSPSLSAWRLTPLDPGEITAGITVLRPSTTA